MVLHSLSFRLTTGQCNNPIPSNWVALVAPTGAAQPQEASQPAQIK